MAAELVCLHSDAEAQGVEQGQATYRRRLVAGTTSALLAALLGTLLISSTVRDKVEDNASLGVTGLEEVQGVTSTFVTSAKKVRSFKYKKGTKSLIDAFKESFPDDGWWNTTFAESPKPEKKYYWRDVVYWVIFNLLDKSPFNKDGDVPIPFTKKVSGQDQLEPGEYVGYSRRQVCYLTAKALIGARFDGYDDGLTRFLSKGEERCARSFSKALFGLLATCSADPTIQGGKQGPMLFVVKHHAPQEQDLKQEAEKIPLSNAGFRMCRYDDGSVYKQGFLPGVPTSPADLCAQPSSTSGTDFISTRSMQQALVAPSDGFVGGKLLSGHCSPGGTLEEDLMLLMPEVAVLSLTLSQAQRPQLRSPAWVLGARTIMTGFDGTGHFMFSMRLDGGVRMKSDVTTVTLKGQKMMISKSKPFVSVPVAFQESFKDYKDMKHARQNRALPQRQVEGKNSLGHQVAAWYHALSLHSAPKAFQPILSSLVRSIGTGPWIAGSRFGDSQIDVLSIWLAQALVSKTWTPGLLLDYYLYAYYHENPGNQCFLHAAERCGACAWTCQNKQFPAGSFFLPDFGFMSEDHSKPCVLWSEFACPTNGIENVFWYFGLRTAGSLWSAVESALSAHNQENTVSVFDRLMDEVSSELHNKLNPKI